MATPPAATLLDTWERGATMSPADRAWALWLLCDAAADIADPTIGQRDRALLGLRAALFGDRADVLTSCASCGEVQEATLSVAALAGDPAPPATPLNHSWGGFDVRVRVPTHRVVAGEPVDADALLARCLLEAKHDGVPCTGADLPAELRAAVADLMADADPGADIVLDVRCDTCGARSQIPFDTPSLLWSELGTWAARLVREVHALAAAYGWAEADVLALTPHRRRRYLELVAP